MKKIIIFAILPLFIIGCTPKKVYVHDPLKNELLAYTQKFEDVNDKFLVIATYLNPIHQDILEDKQNEYFILSIYPKESVIDYRSFKVNNDSNATKIKVLANDDPLLKLTTFKMPWGKYLKVSAPQIDSDTLNLTFDMIIDLNGTSRSLQVSLNFRKIAKSLYWNSK
ncbi:hypothetical protein CDQ77_06510 [Campylobacter hyointestinalis subsp. hyointestinalis]|uniref:hypothetical protein n=1 Tax=Campylobacter hyointestinalis TaxID=198 RepID=UPI000CE3F27A|nr:hypothetical protein [Campylobacter hyointestinalis]PPB69031.1 hypothetical protein CDQ77_06510 [Campylobacter hyointestinalis subsp. hyointestinalis]